MTRFLSLFSFVLYLATVVYAGCQGCFGGWNHVDVSLDYKENNINGSPIHVWLDWQLYDHKTGYHGKLAYDYLPLNQGPQVCSQDGVFCIQDELYKGDEFTFHYELSYQNSCSRYVGHMNKLSCTSGIPGQTNTVICKWQMQSATPKC